MRFAPLVLLPFLVAVPVAGPAWGQAVEGYRVVEVEERVRDLTGRVEELTFQILQLQEQLRKQQEDYELRFQELEDQRGDAGSGAKDTKVAEAKSRLEKLQPIWEPSTG